MNEYMTANRAFWEAWTSIHERSEFYDVDECPFTVFPALPYLIKSDDGSRTWRLPEPYDGKLPLLFSLKATKPAR